MSIHIVAVGNVTRDPEVREAGSSSVTKFGIASNRRVKGEDVPTFLDVEVWAEQGGNFAAEHFKKGSLVVIAGTLEQQNWEDKETGAKRSKHICKAYNVSFGPSQPKKKEEEATEEAEAEQEAPAPKKVVVKKPAATTTKTAPKAAPKPAPKKPAQVLETEEETDDEFSGLGVGEEEQTE